MFSSSYITVSLIHYKFVIADKPVCCVPDEWEGPMFFDCGAILKGEDSGSSYINGSIHFAYSIHLKKIYLGIKGVEQSPLIPKPTTVDYIILYDFLKVNTCNNVCCCCFFCLFFSFK